MSDHASINLIRQRIEKLETEASRDSQENEYIKQKIQTLSSRVHQIIKVLKS
jgi:cell division protein FtsL